MNNNITEDYCSFEVSKLLKEKGFDCMCDRKAAFTDKNKFYPAVIHYTKLSNCDKAYADGNVLVPTHALAIKWIRENFAIELWVQPYNDEELSQILYEWRGFDVKDDWNDIEGYEYFHSPEEATEAALLYTLKNLI